MQEARIQRQDAAVGIAEAGYRPDWGVEVGYGIRDDLSPLGDTPDLFSAAVSVQLPVFTGKRQDRRLSAAQGDLESARAARLDVLRELRRDLRRAEDRLRRLGERVALYTEGILPQSAQTLEAARRGYRADTTDFPEVVRSELAVVDARIERARLTFAMLELQARVRFLLGDPEEEGSSDE